MASYVRVFAPRDVPPAIETSSASAKAMLEGSHVQGFELLTMVFVEARGMLGKCPQKVTATTIPRPFLRAAQVGGLDFHRPGKCGVASATPEIDWRNPSC